MKLDATTQAAMLDAFEISVGTGPTLELRSGAPSSSLSSQATQGTLIAIIALPSDYLANAVGATKAKLGTWTTSGPGAAAAGTVGHCALKDSAGSYRMSAAVSFTASAWATNTAYAVGAKVTANGNTYSATTAGTSASSGSGPTGTGASITDGTVVWAYQTATGEVTLDNTSVTAGQAVTVSSFTISANNS